MSMQLEDFTAAARRLFKDGDRLFQGQCYMTAAHLFGLAAECAIKARLQRVGQEARLHLPDLVQRASRSLQGREAPGLRQLLKSPAYMTGWQVDNRYWPDGAIDGDRCCDYRDQARRTLHAAQIGGVAP